jgi:G patch domain-containing protein 1
MSNKKIIGTSVPDVDLTKSDAELSRREKIAKAAVTKGSASQGVYDERGRQRFHGAFTGGFSAGYYNTVGSKEGFTPKSFTSSRSQRASVPNQSITDFMDAEDLADMDFGSLGGGRLAIASDFVPSRSTRDAAATIGAGANTPGLVPLEFLSHDSDSVGYRLLKLMGWREGRAVGPKRLALTEEDENSPNRFDSKIALFSLKDNSFGLGYDPMRLESRFGSRLAQGTALKRNTRVTMGTSFGGDEDDLIYGSSSASFDKHLDIGGGNEDEELSLDLSSIRRMPKKIARAPKRTAPTSGIPGFVRAVNPPLKMAHFAPPKIPSDFNPVHRLPDSVPTWQGQDFRDSQEAMTAARRSHLLGEETLPQRDPQATQILARNQHHNPQEKSDGPPPLMALQSRFTTSSSTPMPAPSTTTMSRSDAPLPFADDPQKKARFEKWIRNRRGLESPGPPEEGIEASEVEEFSRAWGGFGQLPEMMSKRFVSTREKSAEDLAAENRAKVGFGMHDDAARAKMFGRLTRRLEEWTPSSLLCKRMGVHNPVRTYRHFPHQGSTGEITTNQATKEGKAELASPTFLAQVRGSSAWRDVGNQTQVEGVKHSLPPEMEDTSMVKVKAELEEADSTPLPPIARPPMDLFKSIFEDDALEDNDDEPEESPTPVRAPLQAPGKIPTPPDSASFAADSFFKNIADFIKTEPRLPSPPRNTPSVLQDELRMPMEGPALPHDLPANYYDSDGSESSRDEARHRKSKYKTRDKHQDKHKHKHKHKHKDKHKDRHKEKSKKRDRYSDSEEDNVSARSSKRSKH